MLALRVFSAWRARFLADLIFATGSYRVLLSKSRVLFVPGPPLSMTIRTVIASVAKQPVIASRAKQSHWLVASCLEVASPCGLAMIPPPRNDFSQ